MTSYMPADGVVEGARVGQRVGRLVSDDRPAVDGQGNRGSVHNVVEGGARNLSQFHRTRD